MAYTLETKIRSRSFAITVELVAPPSADSARLLRAVAPLRGRVDAVTVASAPTDETSTASFAAAAILAANGYEPVLRVSCRDRNRAALTGDLLGSAALGVGNLLIVRGDGARTEQAGASAEATAALDSKARELVMLARNLRSTGLLPSGRRIEPRPKFFIGTAEVLPRMAGAEWSATGLLDKIEAGADFVVSQPCFDLEIARRYMRRLDDEGISERLGVVIGVALVQSAKSARRLNEKHGFQIPKDVLARLEGASAPDEEGLRICAELVEGLREIAGVAGAHLIAPEGGTEAIAAVLDTLPGKLRKGQGICEAIGG
jgi:methylenetetrahydrofolate reductase (NADPH)